MILFPHQLRKPTLFSTADSSLFLSRYSGKVMVYLAISILLIRFLNFNFNPPTLSYQTFKLHFTYVSPLLLYFITFSLYFAINYTRFSLFLNLAFKRVLKRSIVSSIILLTSSSLSLIPRIITFNLYLNILV